MDIGIGSHLMFDNKPFTLIKSLFHVQVGGRQAYRKKTGIRSRCSLTVAVGLVLCVLQWIPLGSHMMAPL